MPPREVALADTWSVCAPLATYQAGAFLVVIVITTLISPRQVLLPVLVVFGIVSLLDIFVWWAIATRLRTHLRDGVLAIAVLVRPAGPRTPPRVLVNGRETILRSNTPRGVKPGDSIRVLTNPAGDKVWVSLD